MNEIRQLQLDIAASLWIIPASLNELCERDFLKNRSRYGVDRMLLALESKNEVYMKGDKFYTYRKTVDNVLNPNGYEL